MRFALGWVFKFAFVGVVYLAFTGNHRIPLPETVMGHKVPGGFR